MKSKIKAHIYYEDNEFQLSQNQQTRLILVSMRIYVTEA